MAEVGFWTARSKPAGSDGAVEMAAFMELVRPVCRHSSPEWKLAAILIPTERQTVTGVLKLPEDYPDNVLRMTNFTVQKHMN